LLGCVIDSISIILLTVPVFAPIASALGFDPLAFAIIGIIAVETGLLTPPFGILVFTVKASLPHERVPVGEIFAGCIPFWIILLGTVVLLVLVPETATWLPNLGREKSTKGEEGRTMPAYWVARSRIIDPVEYKKYTDRVPEIVAKYGGKILARGGRYEILEGPEVFHRFVVIEFPSLEQAKACHSSPEYQEASA